MHGQNGPTLKGRTTIEFCDLGEGLVLAPYEGFVVGYVENYFFAAQESLPLQSVEESSLQTDSTST